jgi:hypothetical protein
MTIEAIHHSCKTIQFYALLLSLFLLTSCKGQIAENDIETESPDQAKSTGTMVISSSSPTEPLPTRTPDLYRPDTVRETYTVEQATKDSLRATEWASQPNSTPKPVIVQLPQANIDTPLTTGGPWLIYSSDYGQGEWYVVNADGSGRTQIADAEDRHFPRMYPSSHSDFLAYVVRNEDLFQNEITIFHLPDLGIVEKIDLISYPGLRESTEYDGGPEGEITGSRYALREGPHWSPDGHYLAFTGAIEGPSSDVYIYDTQSNQVKRLTSGSNQAVRLNWSPDSQWIVHREVNGFGAGCYDVATWVSAVDGSRNQRLYQPPCNDVIWGWSTLTSFYSYDFTNGKAWDLRFVDLVENQTTPLFQGDFIPYGFNPITGDVIFEPIPGDSETSQYSPGLYIVSPTDPEPKWIYSEHVLLQWDTILQRLVSENFPCESGDIGSLTSEGELECVKRTLTEADLVWSPDRRWSIDRATGRTLYNASAEPIHEITPYGPNEVIWRPDSSGVFLKSEYALLYMQIPDGDVFLVDDRNPEYAYWVSLD